MLAAVSMFRDEADVAEHVLRHLHAHGVDVIFVADNLSTDDTPRILKDLEAEGLPLVILQDEEPGYYQDVKMSKLAQVAYGLGADWVLPFDADEIWYPTEGTLAEFFATAQADVIQGYGWDHISTANDINRANPFESIVMRREAPQKLPKVAFRSCPEPYVHMGNHDVDRNQGQQVRAYGLEYRHFQYRSLEQLTRKVRNGKEAYDASDLHWNYGTHWRTAGALEDPELAEMWETLRTEGDLVLDPCPVKP